MDLTRIVEIVWFGCFVLVTVDSGWRKINPVFWCLASLVSGPFALLAYGIIRDRHTSLPPTF